MENQQSMMSLPKESQQLALSESKQHQGKLDEMIGVCLAMQKLYGRDVANTAGVINAFQGILSKYPADKAIKAFQLWLEKSQEFPTPADIIGLITRNGRAAVTKETYIRICKMDGSDRNPEDWRMMREYEADQRGDSYATTSKYTVEENEKLRKRIKELEAETHRLSDLLHEARMAKGFEKPKPTMMEKINKTIEAMRESGAKDEDIEEFKLQYHAA